MSKKESWMQKVARDMALNGTSFRDAIIAEEIVLTTQEAAITERTEVFQQLLRKTRNAVANEIASDPTATKNALAGKMMLCGDRLSAEGDFDKAADVYLKAAKVIGWVGAENQVTVIGNLSDNDLKKVRATLERKIGESKKDPSKSVQ